jgi:AraC-like DNA-binding protein
LSGAEKIVAMENGGQDYLWYVIYQNVVTFLSGVIYSILTLLLIRKHQKNIQEKFSNTDEKELQWLKYLSIGLGIIWFIVIFSNDTTIIFSGVVVFVLFIGFFGINQMNIFQTNSVATINIEVPKNEKVEKTMPLSSTQKRYAKSGLTKEMAEKIYSNLNQLMTEESLFNNNDITLTELAKRLDVHSNHLSQVINEKEEKNFYNYINSLRIKEFIKLASLPENKKFTLLSLAYDCGFNSKSTFNKHFKENTGKTPTAYFKS